MKNIVFKEKITEMGEKRSFKLIPGDVIFNIKCDPNTEEIKEGRYLGKSPLQAAKKAFTQICRTKELKPKNKCDVIFTIKETTRDGKTQGKIFAYKGVREKEVPAKEIVKETATGHKVYYIIQFKNTITSYKT